MAALLLGRRMQELAAALHEELPSKAWHVAICAVMPGATDHKGAIVITDDAMAVLGPITSSLEHALSTPPAVTAEVMR